MVRTVDYHAAGEPFRIVSGAGPLPGTRILDKRRYAAEHLDEIRQLLVNEPRGHADMYGCFVTEPEDDGADLGVVFFHNAGYSTACGHGTIALVTWALESGVVPITGPETTVVVDTPSGRLETVATVEGERVLAVRFRNVPAYVHATAVPVATSAGEAVVDIAFGGAFYACLDAAALGLRVVAEDLAECIRLGREIKHGVEAIHEVVHPAEPELRGIYGVIFTEDVQADPLVQRNVAVFADGEVDRSPTGSGTSARLALLDASGMLPRGATLDNRSIVDTSFTGRVVDGATVDGRPAVVTEVSGSAYLTGLHQFLLREDDPLGTGFLLR